MTKEKRPTLADLIESFFRRRLVAQRRASPETISSYRDALRLFLVFTSSLKGKKPSRLSIEELDHDVVLAFLDHLEKERQNSIRTRNARLIAIRSFFHHVAYSDPASMGIAKRVLAIPGKRTTKRVLDYLRADELEAILDAPNRCKPQGRRDYTLLNFLARTGARVSEAVGVNAEDLRLKRPWHVLLRGKGSKQRMIPLDEDIAELLTNLCDERALKYDSNASVFVNSNGQRLSRHGVIHILKRAVVIAARDKPELKKRKISPHSLRHTAAMNLLRSGADLTTIQSWLGHATTITTHQYVEADLDMKRRALEKCDTSEIELTLYQPEDGLLALLESL